MTDFDQWLSGEQQLVWRAYLRGAATLTSALDERLRAFGLTLAEYEILVTLSESSDHRVRMSELASSVQQSRSRLTHTIQRMERAGLVQRVSCAEDGRGVNAELTSAGLKALRTAAPDHVAAVRELLVDAVSPADYAALGRVMTRVTEAASASG